MQRCGCMCVFATVDWITFLLWLNSATQTLDWRPSVHQASSRSALREESPGPLCTSPEWLVIKARGLNHDNNSSRRGDCPPTHTHTTRPKHSNCAALRKSQRGQRHWRLPGSTTQDSDTSKNPLAKTEKVRKSNWNQPTNQTCSLLANKQSSWGFVVCKWNKEIIALQSFTICTGSVRQC